MKKLFCVVLAALLVCVFLPGCGSKSAPAGNSPAPAEQESSASEGKITEETAYEGVSNYCRSAYDWSAAEENPSLMYLEMGEASEAEYQVIFHSYTGALVYFHVNKSDGTTRMTEYVPALNLESDAGTISLYDYLEAQG